MADRKFTADDPKIAEFVEWIETNENDTWLTYLVNKGFNAHLSKYMTSSPFPRGTPIDTRICQLIYKFWPVLKLIETVNFRSALMGYIHKHGLIKKAFPDYEEPY